MRFMIIRKGDAETEAGTMPSRELAEKMMAYHEEMGRHLKILDGNGLHPTARGAKVKFTKGMPKVIDGPFAETKEVVAGYTLVEAASLEEVLEWATKWPPLDGHGEVELEIRRVYEVEEFGDVFEGDLKDQHGRVMKGA